MYGYNAKSSSINEWRCQKINGYHRISVDRVSRLNIKFKSIVKCYDLKGKSLTKLVSSNG
jgi:hypothetical protein